MGCKTYCFQGSFGHQHQTFTIDYVRCLESNGKQSIRVSATIVPPPHGENVCGPEPLTTVKVMYGPAGITVPVLVGVLVDVDIWLWARER
jgi:hypothetical protein